MFKGSMMNLDIINPLLYKRYLELNLIELDIPYTLYLKYRNEITSLFQFIPDFYNYYNLRHYFKGSVIDTVYTLLDIHVPKFKRSEYIYKYGINNKMLLNLISSDNLRWNMMSDDNKIVNKLDIKLINEKYNNNYIMGNFNKFIYTISNDSQFYLRYTVINSSEITYLIEDNIHYYVLDRNYELLSHCRVRKDLIIKE
jgi:hypothetical protein